MHQQCQAALRPPRQAVPTLADAVNALADGVVVQDAGGRVIQANPAASRILGLTPDQLLGRTSLDPRWGAIREDSTAFPGAEHPIMRSLQSGESVRNVVMGIEAPPHGLRWIQINTDPIVDPSTSRIIGAVAVFSDITARHQADTHLKDAVRALRRFEVHAQTQLTEQDTMLDNDLVGMVKLRDRNTVWANRAMHRIFGYEPGELFGQSARLLYPSDEAFAAFGAQAYPVLARGETCRVQLHLVRKDGSPVWVDVQGVALPGAGESMWMMTDLSDWSARQSEMEHLAFHDPLTGLLNRRGLSERLDAAIGQTGATGRHLAVCFLDLNDFKPVNDAYGHQAGDTALRVVARRLRDAIRRDDVAARVGGDEFALLLNDVGAAEDLDIALARITAVFNNPLELAQGTNVTVGASVGVALFPQDATDRAALLLAADRAMYSAKRTGRPRWVRADGSSS
jgi:diguanylate cyclase (GGDEF)-like protein/PAS domain S-box-containing protein